MRMNALNTLAHIFLQISVVLVVLMTITTSASAKLAIPAAPQSIEFQYADTHINQERLAGMIRSSIAFERSLRGKHVQVKVSETTIKVYGEIQSTNHRQRIITILKSITDVKAM